MQVRSRCAWFLLLSAGCQGFLAPDPARDGVAKSTAPTSASTPVPQGAHASRPPETAAPSHPSPSARQLWEKGQLALRQGRPDEAIACYRQSLAADPRLLRVHLSLAAACLEKGDKDAAGAHLGQYLQAHPEHLLVRAQYAELLHRLRRPAEARQQFQRFVADAQDHGEPAHRYLIHSHTRLMEIAEEEASDYDLYLNRGIGLLLLARQRLELPEPDGELSAEGLLCKAAEELTLACQERPGEARPCWYLYEVWSALGQRQPALRRLRQAESAAPFSYLTPAEQGRLTLACREVEQLGRK